MQSAPIEKFLEGDRFAQLCGIELLEVSPGAARARMLITDAHLNGVRIAHGGAIFSLADFAFAAASNSHGTVAVGINVSISYLQAARTGALIAEAREVSRNSKLASYTVEIRDDNSTLVALFQGMVYRKPDPIKPAAA
jgi:acyl-CoA thioesterase